MQQLIDGIGDEVVQFTAVVVIVVVAILAWLSTNARPDRYRTVLVMRSRSHHPITVNIRTRSNLMPANPQVTNTIQTPISNDVVVTASTSTSNAVDIPRDNARVIPLQEMDSIVDADVAMLDHNRLHFYRRIDASGNSVQSAADSTSEESEPQDEPEQEASNAQIQEMDSIVNAMEADVTTGCDFFTRSNASNSNQVAVKDGASTAQDDESTNELPQANLELDEANRIIIKLKYLNDTLKEVEGNLDELLRDFKRRHFSTELSLESRVRLIFNGRVLCEEGATLRACGLHDRAVVHCLVHPKRTGNQQQHVNPVEANASATHELITERPQQERTWDLENILMTLVSIALTVVWFFRCEYSNLFTASASAALLGLTVFYSVAIFGLYLSDTFQFQRHNVQPEPIPNN